MALDGGVLDPEVDARPASAGVVDDVALGGRVAADDEPDPAGQEWQWTFPGRVEQTLGGQ